MDYNAEELREKIKNKQINEIELCEITQKICNGLHYDKVKCFAVSIGFRPQKLMRWMRIKAEVYDRLTPQDLINYRWSDLEKTREYLILNYRRNPSKLNVKRTYDRIKNGGKQNTSFSSAYNHLITLKDEAEKLTISFDKIDEIEVLCCDILQIVRQKRLKKQGD